MANVPNLGQIETRTSSPCRPEASANQEQCELPEEEEEEEHEGQEAKSSTEEDAHQSPAKQAAEHEQDGQDQDMEGGSSATAAIVNGGASVGMPLLKDAVVS